MITSLVEPGGARPGDATRRTVIVTMFAYTALAAIVAGAASIGAGLGVIALGMLFTILIDLRQWRDIVDHDRAHAPPEPPRVALPRREPQRAIAPPTPAVTQVFTSTRLLPYVRTPEPALLEATPEPVAAAAVQEMPAPVVLETASEPMPEPALATEAAAEPMAAPSVKPAAKPAAKSRKPKKL